MSAQELPAGRELDDLIALEVFGWRWMQDGASESLVCPEAQGLRLATPSDEPLPSAVTGFVPAYSTDISAAWALVEKYHMTVNNMGEDGYTVYPSRRAAGLPHGSTVPIGATAATAPLAICLAALNAAKQTPLM